MEKGIWLAHANKHLLKQTGNTLHNEKGKNEFRRNGGMQFDTTYGQGW